MQKVFMYVGIPACGKSTAAKAEIAKNPDGWARINNDDIRAMLNGSVWSSDYEKFITDTRNYLIKEALRRGKDVIIDNLNLNRKHFDDVVKIAKGLNRDIQVIEKSFYIELEEAIERDAKRTGSAHVGEAVIKKWWKESGGKGHKFYKPRTETIVRDMNKPVMGEAPPKDVSLGNAIMCDLDGTVSLFNKINDRGKVEVVYPAAHARNPYDASRADEDLLNEAVAIVLKTFAEKGTKILFCSGRTGEYEPQTRTFLDKHFPGMDYKLMMRKTGDNRKDSIVKEEIYRNNIEGRYNVLFVLDDRTQVVDQWRSLGLTCWQVAPGDF